MFRFASVIFLGALLLFMVQPLIGRFILPWFGGGAGVWTACMLFFQIGLLLGYCYAHGLVTLLSRRNQALIHLALLALSLAMLPVTPDEAWKPAAEHEPVWRIMLLLATTLGAPYILLASTGPLMQSWFANLHPARSPYRLYALSNLGSLLGLLAYPLVMERWIGRIAQAQAWSWGYAAFALLAASCAVPMLRTVGKVRADLSVHTNQLAKPRGEDRPPSGLDRLLWVLLPACASIVLLASTNQLGQEIAPMPFMWVLPLAVYLLTFIIAFQWPRAYNRLVFVPMWLLAITLVLVASLEPHLPLWPQVLAQLLVLGVCGMICHGELYRRRPAPGRLTSYYLAIAVGGALGGLVVSIIAPLVFDSFLEFYLGLYATLALLLTCLFTDRASVFYRGANRLAWLVLIFISLLIGLGFSRSGELLDHRVIDRARNFYGALLVRVVHPDRAEAYVALTHGQINHGAQIVDDRYRRWPALYYGPGSGIGLVIQQFPRVDDRRIGVVGLGAGALAAVAEHGDTIRFYEINPQVVDFAHRHFTFIQDSHGSVEIALGDARLMMERELAQGTPGQFDILVLDAFSGDAIPTHLLTREAMSIYLRYLKPDGVLAFHVTNRYLDLQPIVHRLAIDAGLATVFVNQQAIPTALINSTHWALATRNQVFLDDPDVRAAAIVPQGMPRVSVWTDDASSLLEVLRWSEPK